MKKSLIILISVLLVFAVVIFAVFILNKSENTPEPEGSTTNHTHSFGEWTVTKEATLGEEGERERVCDCGEKEIEILVGLGDGEYSANAWGCDLTYDYVKINGDYRT